MGFHICLEKDFGRLSDAPICNTVSLEAVKEMRTEQAFQLQLIIQILMTDYLQQEIDISEDVGKGSTASSGHITISFAIKSYSSYCVELHLCKEQICNATSETPPSPCGSHTPHTGRELMPEDPTYPRAPFFSFAL